MLDIYRARNGKGSEIYRRSKGNEVTVAAVSGMNYEVVVPAACCVCAGRRKTKEQRNVPSCCCADQPGLWSVRASERALRLGWLDLFLQYQERKEKKVTTVEELIRAMLVQE